VLDRAGARDADMIIAATHSDEVNMVTCQVAHSVFAVPRKIARLRAQSYLTRSIPISTAAITCPSTW
jgi:trk system potassium uptake protein TrkA